MELKGKQSLLIMAIAGLFLGASIVLSGCKKSEPATNQPATMNMKMDHNMAEHGATMADTTMQAASGTEQTLCPVTGSPIDKSVFIEYQGKKVYFCCTDCIKLFKENPEKYVAKLPQFQN
jgi:YHS domain-containing protein